MTSHALLSRHATVAALVPAAPVPPAEEAEDIARRRTFGEVMQRRWRTMLLSAAAGVALAAVYVATVTPQYEATAALRVIPSAPRTSAPTDRADGRGGDPLATEVDLLRSRVLAAEVVDSLGLRLRVEDPTARAGHQPLRHQLVQSVRVAPGADSVAYTLRRSGAGTFAVTEAGAAQPLGAVAIGRPAHFGPIDLTLAGGAANADVIRLGLTSSGAAVDRVQRDVAIGDAGAATGVVELRYRDADPGLARDVLGAYIARDLARHRDADAARARNTTAALQAQLDTVRRARVAAERVVRDFRRREHVIDTKEEAASGVRHVSDLQAERGAIESERQSLSALLVEVATTGLITEYRRLLAYPTLIRTPAATDLLRQIGDVEGPHAAAPGRPTPGVPDAAALLARQREVAAQIRALVRTYLAGLRQQIAALDGQIATVNAELAKIPGRESELARLERDPAALGERETALQKRIEESQLARAAAEPIAELVDPPTVSTRPVTPRSAPDLGLGLLAGLVAGSGLALARDRRDHSVRSRGDLRVASGLPVLAAVPVIQAKRAGGGGGPANDRFRAGVLRLVRGDDGPTPSASPSDVMGEIIDTADPVLDDAYARLYLNVRQRTDSQARSILIASPLPGEGRTTTALGLSTALARRGLRVLLVDADLRRGTLAQDYFGLSPNATGLAELLRGTVKLKSALRVVRLDERATLTYIASGRGAERAAVVVDAAAMRTVLTQVASLFEAVVIDSPPLNLVTDGALLATLADAVILVGRTGVTDTTALGEAAALLRGLGARVVGTLLNAVDPRRDRGAREAREYYRLAAAQRPRTLAVGDEPADDGASVPEAAVSGGIAPADTRAATPTETPAEVPA